MNAISRISNRLLFGVVLLAAAAPAIAQPVLEVRINNAVIPNFSTHEFQATQIGQTTPVIVVLRNIGNQDLVFTENPPVTFSSGFPDSFSIIQPPLETGNRLSPNGSTAFRVDFSPQIVSQTPMTANVFIFTNAGAAPYRLDFRGTVLGPRMVVRQGDTTIPDLGLFAFEDTTVGETVEVEFVIQNQGNGRLDLTGDPRVQIFGGLGEFVMTVTQAPAATVAAGQSTSFRVSFSPTQARTYTTRLFIQTNEISSALSNGLYDIDLEGTGVEAPAEEEPIDETPIEEEPIDETPIEEEPVDETPVDETPVDENPVEEQPIADDDEYLEEEYYDDQNDNVADEPVYEEDQIEELDENGDNDEYLDDAQNDNQVDQDDAHQNHGRDCRCRTHTNEDADEAMRQLAPIVPNPCGFGLTSASLMFGLMSLVGGRRSIRRK